MRPICKALNLFVKAFPRLPSLAALALAAFVNTTAAEVSPEVARWCAAGHAALAQGQADSAFSCFSRAYLDGGMSIDSLYFLLGEYYLSKSALDSALALNYAVKNRSDAGFSRAVLLQRLRIFGLLGWQSEARQIQDSLQALPGARRGRLVPQLSLQAGVGYKYEPRLIDTTFFWGNPADSDGRQICEGEFHSINANVSWNLGKPRAARSGAGISTGTGDGPLDAGIRLGAIKPYYAGRDVFESDSTFLSGGLFARVNDLWGGLSLEYTVRIKRYFSSDLAVTNALDLSLIRSRGSLIGSLMAGYEREDGLSGAAVRHFGWLMGSLSPSPRWSFSLLASGYATDAMVLSTSLPTVVTYLNNPQQPLPDIYRDSLSSETIVPAGLRLDTLSFTQRLALLDTLNDRLAASQGTSTLSLAKTIPWRYLSLSPSLRLSRPLPRQLSAGLECAWRLDYYPDEYEWDELPLSAIQAERYSLALNRTEGRLYGLSAVPTIQYANGSLVLNSDLTSALTHHSQRRIDNTLSGNLSLQREFKRAGTLRLGGYLARTWSSLSDRAPIAIPEWSWSVALSWRVLISPADRPTN